MAAHIWNEQLITTRNIKSIEGYKENTCLKQIDLPQEPMETIAIRGFQCLDMAPIKNGKCGAGISWVALR